MTITTRDLDSELEDVVDECKVLMSHESMSQWVRSEKIKVSVETIKLSITFTYFVYFLHCCLHKAYSDMKSRPIVGCLLAVPRPERLIMCAKQLYTVSVYILETCSVRIIIVELLLYTHCNFK